MKEMKPLKSTMNWICRFFGHKFISIHFCERCGVDRELINKPLAYKVDGEGSNPFSSLTPTIPEDKK